MQGIDSLVERGNVFLHSLLLTVEVVNCILSLRLNFLHGCELNRRYDLFRNRSIIALII
jgi:hypothetical protein